MLLLSACGEKSQPGPEPQPEEVITYVGGDISVLLSYEDNGVAYYDEKGGKISDVLKYMKSDAVGWNAQRVRLLSSFTCHMSISSHQYRDSLLKRMGLCVLPFCHLWFSLSHVP